MTLFWKSLYPSYISALTHLFVVFFFSLHISSQADHVKVRFDEDTDAVTGLKQKTNYGRPIWDKEFEEVRKENPT